MISDDKNQVVPCELEVFGVRVTSRHGLAWELRELIEFAEALKEADVTAYVAHAFYDSNSNCCQIELVAPVRQNDPVGILVRDAARATLTQFEWQDVIDGKPGW